MNEKIGIRVSKEIVKEIVPSDRAGPMYKTEIDELYSYESALCKINCKIYINSRIKNGLGTGFFCELNNNFIPFKKALFTNNHILNKSSIEINKEIIFENCGKIKRIKITKNRRAFTNEELDYTCIEIFDSDNINNYFSIDKNIFNNKEVLKNKEIFILQYPNGGELAHDSGKIMNIDNNIIEHSVSTREGSSGSPLIKRYNTNLVIGIHLGGQKCKMFENKNMYNIATPFDIIIEDIKNKLFYNNKNNINTNIIKYRNTINLIYDKHTKKGWYGNPNILFGTEFVKNNKDKIILKINGKESKLIEEYNLKNGVNNIEINIINKLTNIEFMFWGAISLKNIDDLKYLNTKEINNFSYVFYNCTSLSDIKALQNWNVSNVDDFSYMFGQCLSLSEIKPLQNWNVSNGNNFEGMFNGCSLLSDIKPLQNWNVSNGNNFSYMFNNCKSLSNIKALGNWNVSNGKYFSHMFSYCFSLSELKPLQNWNVSNGKDFEGMFYWCNSLLNVKPLQNWNVSNGDRFEGMFGTLNKLNPGLNLLLKKWNLPKYYTDIDNCYGLLSAFSA